MARQPSGHSLASVMRKVWLEQNACLGVQECWFLVSTAICVNLLSLPVGQFSYLVNHKGHDGDLKKDFDVDPYEPDANSRQALASEPGPRQSSCSPGYRHSFLPGACRYRRRPPCVCKATRDSLIDCAVRPEHLHL